MPDFIERREHLANREGLLLTLERNPHDSEALNAVFRGLHHHQNVWRVSWNCGKCRSGA
jgi:hypothetical protein